MKRILSNAVKFAAGFAAGFATMFMWPFIVAFEVMKDECDESEGGGGDER